MNTRPVFQGIDVLEDMVARIRIPIVSPIYESQFCGLVVRSEECDLSSDFSKLPQLVDERVDDLYKLTSDVTGMLDEASPMVRAYAGGAEGRNS